MYTCSRVTVFNARPSSSLGAAVATGDKVGNSVAPQPWPAQRKKMVDVLKGSVAVVVVTGMAVVSVLVATVVWHT